MRSSETSSESNNQAMESSAGEGVSVVICCHNSSSLIGPTLKKLQQQKTVKISWEVLIVDNCSSDDTVEVVESIWQENPVTDLRVIRENQLGLAHARTAGLKRICCRRRSVFPNPTARDGAILFPTSLQNRSRPTGRCCCPVLPQEPNRRPWASPERLHGLDQVGTC